MLGPRLTWLAFGACLAVVALVMGWLTVTVLRLDHAEVEAGRQALVEENIRLALWRMDSAMGPLIAAESARPYFVYTTLHAPLLAYTRDLAPLGAGQILLPSELLTARSPQIRLHFQIEPDGRLTSPQVPSLDSPAVATLVASTRSVDLEVARELLNQLAGSVSRDRLVALLPARVVEPPRVPESPALVGGADRAGVMTRQQASRNTIEQQARHSQAIENLSQGVEFDVFLRGTPRRDVRPGPMRPVWLGDLLILARQVSVGGSEYLQGCWLDWPAIREGLLAGVADLLPEATLRPALSYPVPNGTRMLASVPVELVPGTVSIKPIGGQSPLRWSLLVAWSCAILAAAAVAALLLGVLSLSERRAAFVSAVTHELRTPLTTFKLYTEMLAGGMVPDEAHRQRYLDTLRSEALRLGHLVENVLVYARLEGRRATVPLESVPVADLIARLRERLATRAESAGMNLVVEMDEAASKACLRADTSAVEQILFNLVDNACKYAAGASDRRIHLSAQKVGERLELQVRDHGPGIAAKDARRVFRPFFKSAQEAARTAPGVGLGLALSRQLARSMKGTLELSPVAGSRSIGEEGQGACFRFALPCV